MSPMLPLLFTALWADLERPYSLRDQSFGMGLHPDQLSSAFDRLYPALRNKDTQDLYYRPFLDLVRYGEGSTSTITPDKDAFKVMIDVQQFSLEEISVDVVDRFVIVEANHDEKKDEHGFVTRSFQRKYLLPEHADESHVTPSLSSDGILTITAPTKEVEKTSNKRNIKIEFIKKPVIRTDAPAEGTSSRTEGQREETTTEAEV